MMNGHSWYSTTVRGERTQENGTKKKVRDVYFVDATCFTEAESRIISEVGEFYESPMVVAMKMENISEVFHGEVADDDKWFKFKVNLPHFDEATGKMTNNFTYSLVQSTNTDSAIKRFHECMQGTMSDYEIKSVSETNILDLYTYERENESDLTR